MDEGAHAQDCHPNRRPGRPRASQPRLLLARTGPRAAAAQERQTQERRVTLDVRPVAATLGYAWRVAPGRLVGVETGFRSHLGLFVRRAPSDRVAVHGGLRASVADVTTCDTSDCLPGLFGGAYASAFYGRRRVKVGALVQAGRVAEPGASATTVLNVSPLLVRFTF